LLYQEEPMPSLRHADLTQFLAPGDWERLGDPAAWRWVVPRETQPALALLPQPPESLAARHWRWAGQRGNAHTPPHREIMLTLKGEAVYFYDGRVFLRQPGMILLLDRHKTRDLKGAKWKTGFSCLWLHLVSHDHLTFYINTCDSAGRYVHELPMRSLSGEVPRGLMEAWDECAALSAETGGKTRDEAGNETASWRRTLARRMLEARLLSCVIEILGHARAESPRHHHEQVVGSIKNYIAHHLADDLSLHSLANIAGYSPYFFHRLFQRRTGQTPVQYVNALRLARACELLRERHTVEATALAVGFRSVSYFHEFFKRHIHLSPRTWVARQEGP